MWPSVMIMNMYLFFFLFLPHLPLVLHPLSIPTHHHSHYLVYLTAIHFWAWMLCNDFIMLYNDLILAHLLPTPITSDSCCVSLYYCTSPIQDSMQFLCVHWFTYCMTTSRRRDSIYVHYDFIILNVRAHCGSNLCSLKWKASTTDCASGLLP